MADGEEEQKAAALTPEQLEAQAKRRVEEDEARIQAALGSMVSAASSGLGGRILTTCAAGEGAAPEEGQGGRVRGAGQGGRAVLVAAGGGGVLQGPGGQAGAPAQGQSSGTLSVFFLQTPCFGKRERRLPKNALCMCIEF